MGIEGDDMHLWSCIHCGEYYGHYNMMISNHFMRPDLFPDDPKVCDKSPDKKHEFKF